MGADDLLMSDNAAGTLADLNNEFDDDDPGGGNSVFKQQNPPMFTVIPPKIPVNRKRAASLAVGNANLPAQGQPRTARKSGKKS